MSLEAIYETMNVKNRGLATVNKALLTEHCYATYALGNWYLLPSFRRLMERMKGILGDNVYFYTPEPTGDQGQLHLTLLQHHSFKTAATVEPDLVERVALSVKKLLEINPRAYSIQYRGLVWTSSGLALCGYPEDPRDYANLLQLRKSIEISLAVEGLPYDIPYDNDIVHSTLFRWKKMPSRDMLERLEAERFRWAECVFGNIHVNSWIVGRGSWRQRSYERNDYYKVPLYSFIAHRGNLRGPSHVEENAPDVLDRRDEEGIAVECDVWYRGGQLWLGHDMPQYKITLGWLAASPRRLIHAKDGTTFEYLLAENGKRALGLHIFYHTSEDYALTNKGIVIVCPNAPILEGSLCMMPEMTNPPYCPMEREKLFFLCSDRKDGYSSHFGY
jgi:hypothetical protein